MRLGNRRGFTLIELLFVVGLIGILSAIAAPALTRTKMAANESSAIASMRVAHSGQQTFWASCGNGNYAVSLQDLGLAPPGALVGFVSNDISGPAPVVKSGYEFDLASDNLNPAAGNGCNGRPLGATYHVTADPLPSSGRRYFGSNGAGAIFQSSATLFSDMPDVGTPPAPAVPIQQ
jgi:type IV pilus assembly protein PilA